MLNLFTFPAIFLGLTLPTFVFWIQNPNFGNITQVVFSVPTWQILNALERQVVLILSLDLKGNLKKTGSQILKKSKTGCVQGYRVVTSSGVVTGHGKHDNR